MRDEDKRDFKALMVATLEMYNRTIGADALRIWWAALSDYSLEQVRAGISAHMQGKRGQFPPLPADIIQFIKGESGHIGTEEAWALALDSTDEHITVVWTDEIAQAMAVARPCLEAGDKFGASKAFASAYERILRTAPAHPKWTISMGRDTSQRQIALESAVKAGRLKHEAVAHLLPPPETDTSKAIAGLLTGKTAEAPAGLDPRWKELGEQLREGARKAAEEREARRQAEAAEFEAKRKAALDAIEAHREA